MRCRFLLLPLLIAGMTSSAQAGIIFGKKPKPVPEKRVPELLVIIKTDGDENKRYEAVEELRQYDPTQFPQIVPGLIDVLMNDKKAAVRSEAAQSLAKLRPLPKPVIQAQIIPALEYARDKDDSLRVRTQARKSLLDFHWFYGGVGTDPGKLKPDVKPSSTKEPPLAPSPQTTPVPVPQNPGPRATPIEPMPLTPVAPIIPTPPAPAIRTTPMPLPAAPVPVTPGSTEKGPQLD